MKGCGKQSKFIDECKMKTRELQDDVRFLDEELMQCRVENYNLKVKLANRHNRNKIIAMSNVQTREELEELYKVSQMHNE